MRRVGLNAKSSVAKANLPRLGAFFASLVFFLTPAGAVSETISLPFNGIRMDFAWVTVGGSDGFEQVEIGDFGGGRVKERKRLESIYAPFERNGQRGYYLGKTEVTQEQWAAVTGGGAAIEDAGDRQDVFGGADVFGQGQQLW